MATIVGPQAGSAPRRADCVIIGAGIVGVASAFFAARAGLSTVLVEKREGPGLLATAASSECIREQWNQPHNIRMMHESLGMIERFAALTGLPGYDIGLHQQGYLFLTSEPEQARRFERLVALQHSLGLATVELLDRDALRRRFPWVAPEAIAGRFNRRDGWLAVHELLWGFLKATPCTLVLEAAVTGIRAGRGGISGVETSRGPISTERVVIAGGPFAGKLAALAGVDVPLLNTRHQEVRLARHDLCPARAPMVVDDDTHIYWRPDGPAALLGGGETDNAAGEPLDVVPADWDFAAEALEKAMRLSPFWANSADTLKADEVFINAGQYSYVVDHCPVIGPTPVPGLYLNCAYDGHGIMGAPAGGKLLVDLMTGRLAAGENPFPLARIVSGRPLDIEEAVI